MTPRAVTFAAAITLAACASNSPARPYEFPLRPPSSYANDFLDRQTLVAKYGDHEVAFDAVLQKRGDEITLLGLTPFGSRAFVLRQIGTNVTFESFVPQTLPFPPKYILIDVHRVVFDGIAANNEPLADGVHSIERDGEIITERWKNSRIVERRFQRVDSKPPGEIVIAFDGDKVEFKNGWFGYSLSITTRSHQPLPSAAASGPSSASSP